MVSCVQCGLQDQEDGAACVACGAELPQEVVTSQSSLPPPIPLQQPVLPPGYGAGAVAAAPVEYAGFWLRAVAAILDYIILAGTLMVIVVICEVIIVLCNASDEVFLTGIDKIGRIVFFIMGWIYFAVLESSPLQGTPGKLALKLKVTDLDGSRLSFARASYRYFGKIVSSILFIGYIRAAFNPRKQALHDSIAGCLVVRK
ncbi:MAG: RDD family protein [Armatimonadota bacterium]